VIEICDAKNGIQQMTFVQATIPVQNAEAFGKLKSKLDASFAGESVEKFLKAMKASGLRAREFEALLEKGVLGPEAKQAYGQLPLSDQAQIREHFLTKVEEVAPELRAKFRELYRYQ